MTNPLALGAKKVERNQETIGNQTKHYVAPIGAFFVPVCPH